jgi:RND family efflux transporter MFP subunit
MEKKTIVRLAVGILFLFAIIVAVTLFIYALKTRSTYKAAVARQAGKGVPVKTTTVKLEDIEETIGGNFEVEPLSSVDVYSLISSNEIKDIKADLGTTVNAKQLLITLDDTLVLSALKAAESEVQKTEMALANDRVQYNRLQELYSKGYATSLQVEEAQLKIKTAEANYADALKVLQQAKEDVKNATIVAPVKGIITQRKVDPGQSVKANTLLMTIANINNVFVVASIAEEKAGRIFLGQDADIVFDSYPNLNVSGKVYKIEPGIDTKKRAFNVYIKVQNKGYQFKPGMAGYARLKFHFKGLVIPSLALIKNQNVSTVFVVENKTAHLRQIKVEREFYDKVEVVSGLKEGEEVVYYGQLNLRDGDTVNTQAWQ